MVFSGADLAEMELERPFGQEGGSLEVVVKRDMKPTFGTGIHTITPAHNIDDLRISYECNLSRQGCLDSETGTLTQP